MVRIGRHQDSKKKKKTKKVDRHTCRLCEQAPISVSLSIRDTKLCNWCYEGQCEAYVYEERKRIYFRLDVPELPSHLLVALRILQTNIEDVETWTTLYCVNKALSKSHRRKHMQRLLVNFRRPRRYRFPSSERDHFARMNDITVFPPPVSMFVPADEEKHCCSDCWADWRESENKAENIWMGIWVVVCFGSFIGFFIYVMITLS